MQRVTQGMMHTQLLRNLNSNMYRMDRLMEQMTSGRKINKPSDDPVGITFSLRYRTELDANAQYQSNADAALSWLEYTDMIMNQAVEMIHRFRELAIKAANDTNDDVSRRIIKSEMEELYDQMIQLGNSQFNGKYVFNGQLTDHKPYTTDEPYNESTDDAYILFDIGAGVRVNVNVTGNQVFGRPDEDTNLFLVMRNLMDSFDPDNPDKSWEDMNDAIGRLDQRLDSFLEIWADVGAKVNRIELSEDRLKDININLQTMKSNTEDADMALVLTNLKMAENVYQASLAGGARLITPSLIDFLR